MLTAQELPTPAVEPRLSVQRRQVDSSSARSHGLSHERFVTGMDD
jgi:hypothetical protein